MKSLSTHDRGSTAIKCIEEAWTQLRELHSHLPRAVIVLLDAATRNRRRGHFAQSAWQSHGQSKSHEIGISPALFGSPKQLLATLLHEAAHAINYEKKLSDCSGRYYHRKEFRDMSTRLGLDCRFRNTRYGWSITGWPQNREIPPRYLPILKHLQNSLPRGSGVQPSLMTRGKRLPKTGHVRLECRCPRSLYTNHTVADKGGISCSICNSDFCRLG
jgi:SprT-like family